MEKVKRSIVKTMSWRILATLITFLISWIITGTLAIAIAIGIFELTSKLLLYFFHERLWNKIKWGR